MSDGFCSEVAINRLMLIGLRDSLSYIIEHGIKDADWYYEASELYRILDSIDESSRTEEERTQRRPLLGLTSSYEDKHYRHGN